MQNSELTEEIGRLRKERNAVILAHNYQRAEVQSIADYTGDSLELARRATQVDADVIVFCGVYFMAETAAILNPGKTVLIPDPSAGCPMADMINAEQLRAFKAKHPGAKAVCYVNSTAEVKAECDMCVTSGNAERVMATFPPEQEIIFVPDQHLGGHIAGLLGRRYELWPGFCPTHAMLTAAKIEAARAEHPGAIVLVHPECAKDVRDAADHALSTGGMCKFARESDAKDFILGTEVGILHRLRTENPGKTFYPVTDRLVCPNMKKTTLDNLAECLREMKNRVVVREDVASRARRAIEAMLAIS
ncbi:MAG: quinolinate synthase NadA [Lentisphaerae bacterium]|jgi:quinolinate synthase|nr:quinolinate synthase NadA [Lentisphaerota bacterium]